MNTKILILVALTFACASANSPNVFGGNIFGSFQGLSTGPFYGFDSVAATSQDTFTSSNDGFAKGVFSSVLGADNTKDDSGTVSGVTQLVSVADDKRSGVSLISENTADANGPGRTGIVAGGAGKAQFGNSQAGFGVYVAGQNQSKDAKTDANIAAAALTKEGYSASTTQFCVGANCP